MEPNIILLVGIILAISIPATTAIIVPYTDKFNILGLFMKACIVGVLILAVQEVVIPDELFFHPAILGFHAVVLVMFSAVLQASTYTFPSDRFYPRNTIKIYENYKHLKYTADQNTSHKTGSKDEEFTIELHDTNSKFVRSVESKESLLGSISPNTSSKCWYCGEHKTIYIDGYVHDYRTVKSQFKEPPKRSLCKDCMSLVFEGINKKTDKEFKETDIVLTQI